MRRAPTLARCLSRDPAPWTRSGADASAMRGSRPAGVADINEQRDHDDRHQRDRQRSAEWPVATLAELQLDEIAYHQVGASAHDTRRDIGAERGDEDEDRAGNNARLDERDDHLAQHLEARRI